RTWAERSRMAASHSIWSSSAMTVSRTSSLFDTPKRSATRASRASTSAGRRKLVGESVVILASDYKPTTYDFTALLRNWIGHPELRKAVPGCRRPRFAEDGICAVQLADPGSSGQSGSMSATTTSTPMSEVLQLQRASFHRDGPPSA